MNEETITVSGSDALSVSQNDAENVTTSDNLEYVENVPNKPLSVSSGNSETSVSTSVSDYSVLITEIHACYDLLLVLVFFTIFTWLECKCAVLVRRLFKIGKSN